MEKMFDLAVLVAYFTALLLLAAFGVHRWYLLLLYLKHRPRARRPAARFGELPTLTVQLPMFNEMYVARRAIDAACALDYPRDRLQIQVLDDSTDETTAISRREVERRRAEGFDIELLHRDDRKGFKAGALAEGLVGAKGELIAIFDADFVPGPDFARRLVDHFTDPRVGMVQARWGHLNRRYSPLTRVQAMLLDGHFVIEHTARNRSGRFFNFNGTAGIWRRRCIDDAGGWEHDTLTEDLDLSYRAQMRGWRFVYVPDHVVPAELPVEIPAFKTQQHRWAKGSVQTARKLLPRLLRSALPLRVKTEAVLHLTANLGYPLMMIVALLVVPAVWIRSEISRWTLLAVDLPIVVFSTLSVVAFYVAAHREALGHIEGALRRVPLLMAVGIGLSVNNTRAVLEALSGRRSPFRRTPKYDLRSGERPSARRYRGSIGHDTWIELALAGYFAVGTAAAAAAGLWGSIPFLLLFEAGYAYTAIAALRSCPPRVAMLPRPRGRAGARASRSATRQA